MSHPIEAVRPMLTGDALPAVEALRLWALDCPDGFARLIGLLRLRDQMTQEQLDELVDETRAIVRQYSA